MRTVRLAEAIVSLRPNVQGWRLMGKEPSGLEWDETCTGSPRPTDEEMLAEQARLQAEVDAGAGPQPKPTPVLKPPPFYAKEEPQS